MWQLSHRFSFGGIHELLCVTNQLL